MPHTYSTTYPSSLSHRPDSNFQTFKTFNLSNQSQQKELSPIFIGFLSFCVPSIFLKELFCSSVQTYNNNILWSAIFSDTLV